MKKLLASLALSVLCFSSPVSAADFTKVDLAVAAPGAAWYVGFGAYAKVISQMYPDIEVTMFPGGGISNIIRVAQGKSQVGLTAVFLMRPAVEGKAPFNTPLNVKALGNLNDACPLYLAVPAENQITDLRDLVTKKLPARVSVGSKVGGTCELLARLVFDEYGFSKEELLKNGGKYIGGTTPETVAMLQENQLDLDMYSGIGKPQRYMEVVRDKALRFLELDQGVIDNLVKKYGLVPFTIPAGFMEYIDRDLKTVNVPTTIVINGDVSDDLAYKLARALVEGAPDIGIAVPAWTTINKTTICKDLPIEIHPGAAKYYKEIGCF